jgi:hypothetical protein
MYPSRIKAKRPKAVKINITPKNINIEDIPVDVFDSIKVTLVNSHHPNAPRSVNRYYSIVPIGTGICDLTFYYEESELDNQIENNLKVWKYNNGFWTKYIPSNINADSNLVKITEVTSFSDWVLSNAEGDASLPIELVSFNAIPIDKQVNLEWITESEVENLGFNIYRTVGDSLLLPLDSLYRKINFEIIRGAGTSSQKHEYCFIDRRIECGMTYWYKLESVNYCGTLNFSDPISAEFKLPNNYSFSQNYPNPLNTNTKICYQLPKPSTVKINIYDISGILVEILVNEQKNAGYYTVNWNARNKSSGLYFIRIEAGEFSSVKKCLVIK